ncbi:PQQ-binding-like beta-propeller repeat protein [Cellulomonas oligotrophica]|uniref:Outer membrane protein assembly factor BamB n=1 Tax=Cellulomonas oligotrophica TaxID=931536 RepID=A0A7Y9FG26_9CELL|nr:PQQ-binding-like beta-propeller repeat protein [Cellulomonas oligotrophica]NYD86693.1 outer membrane protein assembly factor BamB [Cellulomonas oligotrophica]
MARAGRVEVELVEDDADGRPGAPGPRTDGEAARATARRAGAAVGVAARGVRRRFRPWWLVPPLVLALGLGAAQHVTDARERERLAALAQVPGVLPLLDGPLEPVWTSGPDGGGWPFAVTDEVVLVQRYAQDGESRVDAHDLGAGEQAWSALLPAPVLGEGVGPGWFGTSCAPPRDGTLVCLASSGPDALDLTTDRPGHVEAVVVDTATGAAEPGLRLDVPSLAAASVAGTSVVLVGIDGDGTPVVRALDPQDGGERWRAALDAFLPDDPRSVWAPFLAQPLVPGVVVLDLGAPFGVVLLDESTGEVLDHVADASVPWWADGVDGVVLDGRDATVLWSREGTTVVPGSPVWTPVDDGSFGDVVPVLHGEDVVLVGSDGTERVRVGVGGADSVAVLDGRVVVGDGKRTAVVEPDGTVVWEVRGTWSSSAPALLMTDGRVVVRRGEAAPGGAVTLEAFASDDGRPAWSTTLTGVLDLTWVHGRLLGVTSDGGVALLR